MLTSGKDSVAAQFLPSDEHDIVRCLPRDADTCYELLQVFEGNVDPVIRIVHKPTLCRRFKVFVDEYMDFLSTPPQDRGDNMEEKLKKDGLLHFRPLLFAIFFSSVNSLSDTAAIAQFGLEKRPLMATYQRGLQLSLLAVDPFNSASIELLQAYTLFFSCQLRDETVGRIYSLLAAVTRHAMSLGLHREPTLFSPVPDEVSVEIRRRVWAQLRYVEWRAGELKGVLQSYDEDAFSTRLPRNVNDSDLVVGRVPGLLDPSLAAEEGRYTETTYQVCFHRMVQCARQVGHSVHSRFRKTAQPSNQPAEVRVAEFDVLRQETEKLIASTRERNMRHYWFDDNTLTAPQKLAKMNIKILEWKCWLVFWCGIPREQRKTLLSSSDRMKLLRDSVALVETLNEVALDPDLEKFRWVVQGCSAFQTVMVLIAELRDTQPASEEEVSFRLHALRTLRQTVTVHEGSESRAWAVISKYVEQLESAYKQFAGPERQQPNVEMMTGRSVGQGFFDGYPADNEILQNLDLMGLGWGNGYQGLWPE
ncbi:Transcription factor fungi [Macrophomina phaseolina MS6]|uniref:Transcription factor fungi n=1 Tax=Macrophomina phaseolina (strain MS6) TaxID=1126212 RepID=K2RDP2_MACPH|nr:Transcription factor fungi [Macrophomina phaseolina MS6]